MGTLDDAIREHLELKRRLGASEEELQKKETEAFGAAGAVPPSPPADEPEFQVQRAAPEGGPPADQRQDPWEPARPDDELLEPDEVLPRESLEPNGAYAPAPPESGSEEPHEDPLDEDWEEDHPATEDVLQETPEFLEETPEHDRLWFEQKPPKDFDLD